MGRAKQLVSISQCQQRRTTQRELSTPVHNCYPDFQRETHCVKQVALPATQHPQGTGSRRHAARDNTAFVPVVSGLVESLPLDPLAGTYVRQGHGCAACGESPAATPSAPLVEPPCAPSHPIRWLVASSFPPTQPQSSRRHAAVPRVAQAPRNGCWITRGLPASGWYGRARTRGRCPPISPCRMSG